jgi:hypothetical protein
MSECHRRWKSVARKAAKTGSWETALSGVEFMPLDQVQGDFSVNNASALLFEGDNLWLNDTFEVLSDVTADRACSSEDPDAWAKSLEGLTVSGLDHFWFALCLCVTGVEIIMWRDLNERRRVAQLCVPKLLHWWPQLCVFDQRFSHGQKTGMRGWSLWAQGLRTLCEDLGARRADVTGRMFLGPQALAESAAEWLQKLPKVR